MLSYRHAFHAGNFADVVKHVALALCLDRLNQKPAAYRYIDTHAGIGLYDLSSEEAQKTGEWQGGIAKMQEAFAPEVEALLEMEREAFAHHTCAGYTDFGLPGDDDQRRYAVQCAQSFGWRFEHHPGDPSLLRDLLHGPWDAARFLVVPPGRRVAQAIDARVMQDVPVPS